MVRSTAAFKLATAGVSAQPRATRASHCCDREPGLHLPLCIHSVTSILTAVRTASISMGLICTALVDSVSALAGPRPDLSGHRRVGIASFYARSFDGRTMANGAPMNPRANNAASRTLPLGTIAKVTNLETGKSAIVRIEDRGPYVKGRIVDLSPRTAREIGITRRKGISRVVVAPIVIPLPDGRVKRGAGWR